MPTRARDIADLVNSNSSITVPVGTDAQRPETAVAGMSNACAST